MNRLIPDSNWLASVQEAKKSGGSLLTALLLNKAAQKDEDLKQVANALGISYGYFIQIKNGERKFNGLSDEVLDRMAAYLELPLLTVYCAADKIPANVLIGADKATFWTDIMSGFEVFKTDPEYSHLFTKELEQLSVVSKLPLVLAYEKASGKTLIRKSHNIEEAVQLHQVLEKSYEEVLAIPDNL